MADIDFNDKNELNKTLLNDYFNDYGTLNFKYGLPTAMGVDIQNAVAGDNNLYEDPTIIGFEIRINKFSSPLFNDVNGFIEYFSTGLNTINEIKERKDIYADFIEQLNLFMHRSIIDTDVMAYKSHYIQKIDGLANLVETKEKRFTEYDKDKIKITMYEDIKLTVGYLATLYKALSYSKLNGKELIPRNLLQFDADIIISEVRNVNLIKTSLDSGKNVLGVLADNVSRYVYHLYECEFEFDALTHGDSIDNTSKEILGNYEFAINYKFSNMEFERFTLDSRQYINRGSINPYNADNLPASDLKLQASGTDTSEMTDEQKEAEKNRQKKAEDAQMFKDPYMTFNVKNADGDEAEENKGILGNIGGQIKSAAGSMVKNLKDQALKQVRAKRDQLINGALNKILEATGLSKVQRISAPYNVYDQNFLRDQLLTFAGKSLNAGLGGLNAAIGKGASSALKSALGSKINKFGK